MNGPVTGSGGFAIHANQGSLGPAGEERRHGRASGGPSEEHGGSTFRANALVGENSKDSSVANELGELVRGGFFGEEVEAAPRPSAFDNLIDERIAQRAIVGSDFGFSSGKKAGVGEEFPVAHMRNDPDDTFGAVRIGDQFHIAKGDVRKDLFVGEKGNSQRGEHVGSEALEHFLGELFQFLLRLFISKGDAEISQNDSSNPRCEPVADSPEKFTNAEDGGQ